MDDNVTTLRGAAEKARAEQLAQLAQGGVAAVGGMDGAGAPWTLNGPSFGAGMRQAPSNLSFIEPHEESTAQELIDKQFVGLCGKKFRDHARLTRYFCAVKIYVRPEELKKVTDINGAEQTIYLPDTVRAEDRFQACTGLVVALGPDAFLDKERRPRGSIYKVGDWLCFPRSDIIRMDFCGIAMGIMTDDRAVIVTDDPTLWSVGGMTFKA